MKLAILTVHGGWWDKKKSSKLAQSLNSLSTAI